MGGIMSNMSHCRFENTLADLVDCQEHLDDPLKNMTEEEQTSRQMLINLCKEIADEWY